MSLKNHLIFVNATEVYLSRIVLHCFNAFSPRLPFNVLAYKLKQKTQKKLFTGARMASVSKAFGPEVRISPTI